LAAAWTIGPRCKKNLSLGDIMPFSQIYILEDRTEEHKACSDQESDPGYGRIRARTEGKRARLDL